MLFKKKSIMALFMAISVATPAVYANPDEKKPESWLHRATGGLSYRQMAVPVATGVISGYVSGSIAIEVCREMEAGHIFPPIAAFALSGKIAMVRQPIDILFQKMTKENEGAWIIDTHGRLIDRVEIQEKAERQRVALSNIDVAFFTATFLSTLIYKRSNLN
jgi:hypothetical protein